MTRTLKPDYWTGLYRERWGRDIVPEAYGHPAKFARALIRKIYAHAVDQGWLAPGDVVLDSFGGVALGGLDANYHGAHWIGCELEQHFVDMGAGCDCTGISKADWVRFYGRWERARTLEGRHWCPRCLAQAKQITDPDPHPQPLLFGEPEPTAAYVRGSGRIPETRPHHYTGNAEYWRRFGFAGSVTLLRGDSRRLLAVVQEAGLLVSSPPYAVRTVHGASGIDLEKMTGHTPGNGSMVYTSQVYGDEPGQLAALPEGDHGASLAISSPPYAGYDDHGGRATAAERDRRRLERVAPDRVGRFDTCFKGSEEYGTAPGQLGAMRDGDHGAALAVSSPPFGEGETQDRAPVSGGFVGECMARAYTQDRQGTTPGNLASMAVSSPPFCDSDTKPTKLGGGHPTRATGQAADRNKGDYEYPDSPGQLGTMPEGEPGAVLAVSSPPFEDSVHGAVFSDAFMENRHENRRARGTKGGDRIMSMDVSYGDAPGNMGNETGDTFWTAARCILEQVYQALRPGGRAIWVVKAFVRDGAVVDFPGQWRALCEAMGFVTLHEHRAMLVEDHGSQMDLGGNYVKRQVARKSFFRRIYEQKYPANRIDFEVVYCMEKPG